MRRTIVILCLLFLLWRSGFSDELFTARVYEFGSNRDNLLFLHYNEIVDQDSVTIIRHFYTLPDSTVAVSDEAVLKHGEFVSSRSRLDQIEEAAALLREGDKLRVQFEDEKGFREKTIAYKSDLLSGPVFNRFVRENWEVLETGQDVHFHLPAPNLLRLVRFKMKRDNGSEFARDGVMVLKMEPSSFLFRFFVNASYFVYDLESRRLEEIHGLTILPTQKDGEWQNTHVNMYFSYDY